MEVKSIFVMDSKYIPNKDCLDNYVTVDEAAKMLGVSNVRIIFLLNSPCRFCRTIRTEVNRKTKKVTTVFEKKEGGCEHCRGTGLRLPGYKVGSGKKAPWLILKEDVENFESEPIGFPRGQNKSK